MENKDYKGLGFLIISLSMFALLMLLITLRAEGLAGVSVYEACNQGKVSCGGIEMPVVVQNIEIIWTQEMENKRLESLKAIEVKEDKPKEEKKQEKPKEVKPVAKGNCTSKVRTDLVNHAYRISGGDMKFIGTIASESMFDVNSIGDNGHSIGLCQFHRLYQPDNHRIYKTFTDDKHKLEFCHEKYEIWRKRGVLSTRLYGSNVWKNGLKKLEISCNN